MDVVIIGAGIGGLTLALSLHQAGIGCRVYESVKALAPVAIPTAALAYHSRHGQLIWREARGVAAGYRWPQFSIHRGVLQMMLLAGFDVGELNEREAIVRVLFLKKRTKKLLSICMGAGRQVRVQMDKVFCFFLFTKKDL